MKAKKIIGIVFNALFLAFVTAYLATAIAFAVVGFAGDSIGAGTNEGLQNFTEYYMLHNLPILGIFMRLGNDIGSMIWVFGVPVFLLIIFIITLVALVKLCKGKSCKGATITNIVFLSIVSILNAIATAVMYKDFAGLSSSLGGSGDIQFFEMVKTFYPFFIVMIMFVLGIIFEAVAASFKGKTKNQPQQQVVQVVVQQPDGSIQPAVTVAPSQDYAGQINNAQPYVAPQPQPQQVAQPAPQPVQQPQQTYVQPLSQTTYVQPLESSSTVQPLNTVNSTIKPLFETPKAPLENNVEPLADVPTTPVADEGKKEKDKPLPTKPPKPPKKPKN